MSKGVVYLIGGTKLIARLYVSLMSLREVYDGEVTILTNNDVPPEFKEMLEEHGFETKGINILEHSAGKHKSALLGKTRVNQNSPYDTTVFIDCDTLVLKEFDELFGWADEHSFVVTQFAAWGTKKGKICNRISQWGPGQLEVLPQERIDRAKAYGKGINVGVYAFKNDATIFNDWCELAIQGMQTFIPDEVACQILLPDHKHFCSPQYFNSSCKYSLVDDDTRIIHYHGRKHASTEKTKNTGSAALWIAKYKQLLSEDRCDFSTVVQTWPDRHAKKLKP